MPDTVLTMPPPTTLLDQAFGPIAFAGSPIDRADHIRADPLALATLRTPEARLLRFDQGVEPMLTAQGHLDWGLLGDAHVDAELVFIGLDGGLGCFVQVPPTPAGGFRPGRANWAVMAGLEAGELAAYGTARALVSWHANHRFCSVCGHSSVIKKGGWQRRCTNEACGADHFPRVDPVAIMLVEHQGRALLGRQPHFPERRYSTLAGFIEPGETIEEAVSREVFEEAGVRTRNVAYVTSQPWPFPSSLMVGCHALADDDALVMDETELEDVRWFSRKDVAQALDARIHGNPGKAFEAPPETAVAHRLMRWWVDQA